MYVSIYAACKPASPVTDCGQMNEMRKQKAKGEAWKVDGVEETFEEEEAKNEDEDGKKEGGKLQQKQKQKLAGKMWN